jgi:hypothetical protein
MVPEELRGEGSAVQEELRGEAVHGTRMVDMRGSPRCQKD